MEFKGDEDKRLANVRRHGIGFVDAITLFEVTIQPPHLVTTLQRGNAYQDAPYRALGVPTLEHWNEGGERLPLISNL
jgi:uncharacterized DUF497 family protein